jgi:hypothetical protein
MQPTTLTGVPAGSQATSGNSLSGPARMLVDCVVIAASCADALNGNKAAATISNGHNPRFDMQRVSVRTLRTVVMALRADGSR